MERPVRLPALDELEALVAAVEEGSLAGAARRLYLTRPAVAKRIDNLEAALGDRLLERSELGVRPTAVGRAALASATRLLEDARTLVARDEPSRQISGVRTLLGQPASAPRTEQLLHETETLFAQVFHTSPDAIAISLLRDGTIVEANDAFCALAGFTRAELHGRTSVDLGLWLDASERARLSEQLREEDVVRGDQRLRRGDGSVVEVAYVAHLLPLQTDDVLLVRLEDVTERRRAERAEAVRSRRHRHLNGLAARLVAGGDPDEFAAHGVRFVAAELNADVAIFLATDPPTPLHSCGDADLVARCVSELGAPEGPQPLVVDGPVVYAAQRGARGDGQALMLAAASTDRGPFEQDDVVLVVALASMVGVAYALGAAGVA